MDSVCNIMFRFDLHGKMTGKWMIFGEREHSRQLNVPIEAFVMIT